MSKWRDIVAIVFGYHLMARNVLAGIINAESWSDVVALSAADYHVIGLTSDKRVLSAMNLTEKTSGWEDRTCCALSAWDGWDIAEIEAGYGTSLIVTTDGTVFARGFDHQGQIPSDGEWKNIVLYNRF